MILSGIRYGAEIAAAAGAHHLDPMLLAAVAAQETGGPGSDSGRNVVGDGGHGHGLFQIDDRSWAFARTAAAMDPAKNADVAATILQANLKRYGGNVIQALSAYNAGAPTATGTTTTWGDGETLGYASSVLRHFSAIAAGEQAQSVADNRETTSSVNALAALGASYPPAPLPIAQPLAAPALVPPGSQAQAASTIGAQADHDEASLVDGGDVFDAAADEDA